MASGDHTRIWWPETKAIIKRHWGKKSPQQIAELVDKWLDKNKPATRFRVVPSYGGVVWQACELGLITAEQRDDLELLLRLVGLVN